MKTCFHVQRKCKDNVLTVNFSGLPLSSTATLYCNNPESSHSVLTALTLTRWNAYRQVALLAVGLSHSLTLSLWLVLWLTHHSEFSFGSRRDMAWCSVPFPFLQSHTLNQFLLGLRQKWSPSEHFFFFCQCSLQWILAQSAKLRRYTVHLMSAWLFPHVTVSQHNLRSEYGDFWTDPQTWHTI